ncbi:MAG: TonB family protein [bacterium]|nr:TonB family protein [bacterium]
MKTTNRASFRLGLLFMVCFGLQWAALSWMEAPQAQSSGPTPQPLSLSRFWLSPPSQTKPTAETLKNKLPKKSVATEPAMSQHTEPEPEAEAQNQADPAPNPEELKNLILAYLTQVDLNRYYPRASRKRGEEGVVSVRVVWGPQLEITELDLAQSSRYPRLDAAALELLKEHRGDIAQVLRQRHPDSQLKGELLLPIRFSLQ